MSRMRVGAGLPELVDEFGDAADHEVVAEVHHEVVVAEPVAGDQDGVRQAEGLFLGEVGDAGAKREPSPTAVRISSAVSPTMMPMSVTPAATRDSMP